MLRQLKRSSNSWRKYMSGTVIIEGIENVKKARLIVLKHGLRLEVLGMKRRGKSCYSIIKKEFGFKGNKKSVLEQFTAWLIDSGVTS